MKKGKKKVEYVEVMEIWKVKRTGEFLTAEKLVARIANGVPLEVYDGYAIEKKLVEPSLFTPTQPKKKPLSKSPKKR